MKNNQPIIQFDGVPKCANSPEEYSNWTAANRLSRSYFGFCTDCTQEYQTKMIMEKRCKYPAVSFDENGDGFLIPLPIKEKGTTLLSVQEIKLLTGCQESYGMIKKLKRYQIRYKELKNFLLVNRIEACNQYREYHIEEKKQQNLEKVTLNVLT